MQARRDRAQRAQLELFRPQAEAIDWHKLRREIQQKTVTLFASNRPTDEHPGDIDRAP